MRKLLFPLLVILLFTGCQKQISTDASEEIAGAAANKQGKFTVCHYDAVTGTSKTIDVTQNALSGHLAHGDLQGSCSSVLTTICDQDWMVKNLDVDHYRNGDPIPQVTDPAAWAALTTGAWCYYNNDPANGAIYGKLYNLYAVNDPRGLAPSGWHVPTNAEFTTLTDCLGGENNAGSKMKETGNTHWLNFNTDATNSSGFTGLPGGNRSNFPPNLIVFEGLGDVGLWWGSDALPDNNFGGRFLNGGLTCACTFESSQRWLGASVRCVRN